MHTYLPCILRTETSVVLVNMIDTPLKALLVSDDPECPVHISWGLLVEFLFVDSKGKLNNDLQCLVSLAMFLLLSVFSLSRWNIIVHAADC